MRKISIENIGRLFLPITAIGALVVSALDLFGLLGQMDWLASRITTITLLLIAAAIIYWLDEQRQSRQATDKVLELVSSGVGAESWSTTKQAMTYLARRFSEVQRSVDQAGMAPSLSPSTEYAEYDQELTRMLKKPHVKYRHVTLLDTTRWKRVRAYVTDPDITRYFVRFYDQPSCTVPSLSFVVIDDVEVVMRHPYSPDQPELWVSIKHIPTIQLFSRYFDTLYEKGTRLEKANADIMSNLDKIYGNASGSQLPREG